VTRLLPDDYASSVNADVALIIAIVSVLIAVVSAAGSLYAAIQSRHAVVESRRANNTAERALSWEQERDRPNVTIEFEHKNRRLVTAQNPENPRPAPRYYELVVRVVNHGGSAEQLTGLTLETVDHSQRTDIIRRGTILRRAPSEPTIEPHTAYSASFNVGNMPDGGHGYIAVARIARGQEIKSEVEHLDDALLADIAEHNERNGYGTSAWSGPERLN
jgi:hypothetical protein